MCKLIIAAAVAALSLHAAHANAAGFPQVDAGISAGTLGIGPEVNLRYPGDSFGLRLGANFLGFGEKVNKDGISYKGSVNLASGGATVDWYPFQTGFRTSLGLSINGNDATVTATPAGTVTIGGNTYQAASVSSLSGKATYNAVAPYIGIGYTYPLFGVLPVSLDAGVIYQGNGNLHLTTNGPIAGNAVFAQDLANESARVRKDLSYASFYPAIQLSVAYRF